MSQTVIIYATGRGRSRLVRQGYEFLAEYDDYVLARASGEQVDQLRAGGYEVEVYRTPPPPALAFEDAHAKAAAGPEALGPGHHYYLVNFVGPIKPEWLTDIAHHGGAPQEPEPPYGYVVALDAAAYEFVRQAPYVDEVRHYGVDLRISPDVTEGLGDSPVIARGIIRREAALDARVPPGVERVPNAFTVRFFQPDDLVAALGPIRAIGGTPSEAAPGSIVITVSFDPAAEDLAGQVARLAALHGVRSVEPYVLRQLRNNVAPGLMGAQEVQDPSGLTLVAGARSWGWPIRDWTPGSRAPVRPGSTRTSPAVLPVSTAGRSPPNGHPW